MLWAWQDNLITPLSIKQKYYQPVCVHVSLALTCLAQQLLDNKTLQQKFMIATAGPDPDTTVLKKLLTKFCKQQRRLLTRSFMAKFLAQAPRSLASCSESNEIREIGFSPIK